MRETQVSKEAGEIVGRLYDALLKEYNDPENPDTLKSLNKLCVRLVFLLYAESAGGLGRRNMFREYLQSFRDWETVIPKAECSYIMGDPPFVGFKRRVHQQQETLLPVAGGLPAELAELHAERDGACPCRA